MSASNAERFLNAFNSIEDYLRSKQGRHGYNGFRAVLKEAARSDPGLRRFQRDLEQLAELRNAIVHNGYTDGHPIADPRIDTVERIEQIAGLLHDPPKVYPLFKTDVATVSVGDTVGAAARVMFRGGYSQVPVLSDHRFADLLTAGTIVRWLGDHASDGLVDLNTPIQSVLHYAEHAGNYAFLAQSQTVFELIDTFYASERHGRKLDAVLITRTGEPSERITGIATIADLSTALRAVSRPGKLA